MIALPRILSDSFIRPVFLAAPNRLNGDRGGVACECI